MKFMVPAMSWSVGDKASVMFWFEAWLYDGPFLQLALVPIPVELQMRSVHSYWHVEHGWCFEKLQGMLPEEVLRQLEFVQLHSRGLEPNTPVWKLTQRGHFLTQSVRQLFSPRLTDRVIAP